MYEMPNVHITQKNEVTKSMEAAKQHIIKPQSCNTRSYKKHKKEDNVAQNKKLQ